MEVVRILRTLGIKKNVSLSRMSEDESTVALACASLTIPSEVAVDEQYVNNALQRWLNGTGSMVRIDHVELRRTLIDVGLWRRDPFGRAYAHGLTPIAPRFVLCRRLLTQLDPDAVVQEARTKDLENREARKAKLAQGQDKSLDHR